MLIRKNRLQIWHWGPVKKHGHSQITLPFVSIVQLPLLNQSGISHVDTDALKKFIKRHQFMRIKISQMKEFIFFQIKTNTK